MNAMMALYCFDSNHFSNEYINSTTVSSTASVCKYYCCYTYPCSVLFALHNLRFAQVNCELSCKVQIHGLQRNPQITQIHALYPTYIIYIHAYTLMQIYGYVHRFTNAMSSIHCVYFPCSTCTGHNGESSCD